MTLSELGRTPFSVNIETQMFKYFQRYPKLNKESFLNSAFQEVITQDQKGIESWITKLRKLLERNEQSNLMINVFEVCSGEIAREKYQSKHNFFLKRTRDCYIQKYLTPNSNRYDQSHKNILYSTFDYKSSLSS